MFSGARSPLRLLEWKIPDAHQRYTRKDTAFYALSLGVGAMPDNPRHINLVDPWSAELGALPSQALILAYPGFWLGEPSLREATGICVEQVLHVEQSVELNGPLPSEANVMGISRVTALVDKGAERGSLLYSERRIIDVDTGAQLAVCRQVHFLRKVGGYGSFGEPYIAPPLARESVPANAVDTPTMQQQALVYRLNGDTNPLHYDYEVAAKAGFARPILHGMCTAGIAVTSVLGALADLNPGRARGFSVRMTAPVFPGESLRTEIWPDGGFRMRAMERNVVVLSEGMVQLTPPADSP